MEWFEGRQAWWGSDLPDQVLGIDEVGRGCYAGPLVVGAVLAPLRWTHPALRDSKDVKTERGRASVLQKLVAAPGARYYLHRTPNELVDSLGGIRAAVLEAFKAIVRALAHELPRTFVVIDGVDAVHGMDGIAIPRADGLVPHCMAAAMIAKVSRDTEMILAAKTYPQYGFERHKGYGTKLHEKTLKRYGPCPLHRRSVRPVQLASST
jgi:ribonuclease HII